MRVTVVDRRAISIVFVVCLVCQLTIVSSSRRCWGRQADNGWIGKRVVPKIPNFRLAVAGKYVESSDDHQVYKVQGVKDEWLELVSSDALGWCRASDVVDVEHALAFFSDAIRANPKDPNPYLLRANVYRDVQNNLDFALADYNEAIRIAPDRPLAINGRGIVWMMKQDYHKAITDFGDAIRIAPADAHFYSNRGLAYRDKGEIDNAIEDFNKAIHLDSKNVSIYLRRAFAKTSKHDYDGAIADYSEMIRLKPTNSAFSCRGKLKMLKKEYVKAIADFDSAIRQTPSWSPLHLKRATLEMLLGGKQTMASAWKAFSLEGGQSPNCVEAALIGHFGARRLGKKDEAQRFLVAAKAKCDKSRWPYPCVGYLLKEINEKELLAAATDDIKMMKARCCLGLDLELKGRNADAIDHFLWVKEHGMSSHDQDYALMVPDDSYVIAIAELDRINGEKKK